ncbi:MAG TPA: response regulator transcription factor [Aggregatilinea sp.]|jgi:DNA-binding response OmpR family regulator|uniref:response regulator transcription factor n=1 Tax=Aggregatilinea sp. TaxID=2806333 RepID=UPI002BBE251D|nr:response regulator transcription factor [Aggregatilinea sp.]HML23741.1 response regulator transcription factor [Aggregatilinea sp.]
MSRTILIADDDAQLRRTLRAYLEDAGFTVLAVGTGQEAVFAVRHDQPDLVLLDVMMPEMDGFEAARLIRKQSAVPILMLTARDDEADQTTGLELGADDYITKPFSPRVLVARVKAALRRAYGDLVADAPVLRVGPVSLSEETRDVKLDGEPLALTRSEFDLLAALMARPGRVFTRMELLERLQGEAFAAYERTVDVHVKNLRAKLGAAGERIETVYGVGYRMRGDE